MKLKFYKLINVICKKLKVLNSLAAALLFLSHFKGEGETKKKLAYIIEIQHKDKKNFMSLSFIICNHRTYKVLYF